MTAAGSLGTILPFLVILSHTGQSLGPRGAGAAAVNYPSNEELTTSLVVNQLAILKMMDDASSASVALQQMVQELTSGLRALKEEVQLELTSGLTTMKKEVRAVMSGLTAEKEEVGQVTSGVDVLPEKLDKAQACHFGWVRYESSCYNFNDTVALAWEDSLSYCRSLGGDLVKITGAGKHQFIKGHLTASTWIGLTDNEREGHFVWADGSAASYTAWNEGEPNNAAWGGENCVYMESGWNYEWNDGRCGSRLSVACEKTVGA